MSDTIRFNIRIREYTPAGVKGTVIPTSTLEFTGPYSNPTSVRFAVSQVVAKRFIEQPIVVALEYSIDGGAWVEPKSARFICTTDDRDVKKTDKMVAFQGSLYGIFMLSKTYLHWSASAKDGQRTWGPMSAGAILHGMLTESLARGWGTPVNFGRSFNATIDSNGVAWPTAAADKITQTYQITTPLSQILSSLVAGGMCEYDFTGLTLNLYRAGTGVDHTVPANGVVRLEAGVTSAPVKSDFSDVFTNLTVIPEKARNYLYLTNPGADSRFGRLEATMSQSGVADHVTATKLAQPALELGRASKREFSVTYNANDAKFFPWRDYNPGDIIQAKSIGPWEAQRVQEITIRKDDDGVVEITTVLSHRFRPLLARMASRTSAASMGTIAGGSGIPLPAGAVPPLQGPKAPDGITGSSAGVWDAYGNPRSTLTVGWNVVTQDTDSALIDVVLYEVWSRGPGGVSKLLATTANNTVTVFDLDPSVDALVKVRARSAAGVWSEFSTELTVDLIAPTDVLPAPTTPTVSSKLGVVTVKWDGLLNKTTPAAPPAQFARVYVTMSTTLTGTYAPTGQIMGNAGSVTVADVPMGQVRWFKLVAVDTRGVASAPSDAASVTVNGVSGPDLEANSVKTNNIEAGAVQAQHFSLGAKIAAATPTERVPSPLTDSDYWGKVIAGTAALFPGGDPTTRQNVSATSTGILFGVSGVASSRLDVTTHHPVPDSREVTVTWVATAALTANIIWRDAANAPVSTVAVSSGVPTVAPATAIKYNVSFTLASGLASRTLQVAHVFESIGTAATLDNQGVVIDPSGLRLTSADGAAVVNLTTNTDQFFSVQKDIGGGQFETQASIDADGTVQGQTVVSNNDFSAVGTPVVGSFATGLINGEQREGALFDRIGWGTVLSADTGAVSMTNVFVKRQGLAAGSVELDANRVYDFSFNWNGYSTWTDASGAGELLAQVWISTTPQDIAAPVNTGGASLSQRLLLNGQAAGEALTSERITLAGFVPPTTGTYYIVVVLLNTTSARKMTCFSPWSRFVIEDVGPSSFSSDLGTTWYTRASSGAAPTTGGIARTATYGCTWSRSWANGGSTVVAGSSQYSNGQSLYQGYSSYWGNQGAMFGFPALGLSGKTIKSCRLYLQNRFFYNNSGGIARLGTSTAAAIPGSFSSTNNWEMNWGKGVYGYANVPPSLWASIASGAIRSFTLGISAGRNYFGYWDGYGQGRPPALVITYK